nr:MAG TPA: Major capsid protein [Caudoviricetes sp.]
MAGLAKEVWINQLTKKFYPDSSFLNYTKDFSSLVENDAINMADAGVDPDVLINNTTYPIQVVNRVDTPIRIELDLFETKNTLVRRPEAIEYSYDQLESVLMGHRNKLRARTAEKAAHAFAPLKDSEFTPVISTTGETSGTRKRMSVEDILLLKERFDSVDIPLEGRYLVLNPKHLSDLILFDVRAFKDLTDIVDGKPKRFAGFNVLQTSATPFYNATSLEKIAFTKTPGDTDVFCSFAFQKEEVMKADGTVHMYAKYDDPEERGTIVGFDKRFIAVPIRNKGIGAIVSKKV